MHWITANPKCDIGHNLHLTRSFAQQGQYCWKLYKLCALRRFVQAEVFRPECFSWSCLYIPADSHRLCSEWITLDIVSFTNLSTSLVRSVCVMEREVVFRAAPVVHAHGAEFVCRGMSRCGWTADTSVTVLLLFHEHTRFS